MALFNSLKGALGNAVGNAVGDGIGKGIQNAVGKAVESAVRPAADKLAGQAADHLNQTAQELSDANAAMRAAAGEAAEGAQELNRPVPAWQTWELHFPAGQALCRALPAAWP